MARDEWILILGAKAVIRIDAFEPATGVCRQSHRLRAWFFRDQRGRVASDAGRAIVPFPVNGPERENAGLAIANAKHGHGHIPSAERERQPDRDFHRDATGEHQIHAAEGGVGAPLFIGPVVACASQAIGREAIGSEQGQALFVILFR
jgi:hypothetical protein